MVVVDIDWSGNNYGYLQSGQDLHHHRHQHHLSGSSLLMPPVTVSQHLINNSSMATPQQD